MSTLLKITKKYLPAVVLAIGCSTFAYLITMTQPWFSVFHPFDLSSKPAPERNQQIFSSMDGEELRLSYNVTTNINQSFSYCINETKGIVEIKKVTEDQQVNFCVAHSTSKAPKCVSVKKFTTCLNPMAVMFEKPQYRPILRNSPTLPINGKPIIVHPNALKHRLYPPVDLMKEQLNKSG